MSNETKTPRTVEYHGWKRKGEFVIELPDYNTYDALIPTIVRWCDDNSWELFRNSLCEIVGCGTRATITMRQTLKATPSQLREAWLKAAGKWKE